MRDTKQTPGAPIIATSIRCGEHADTINDLANSGKIKPIFITYNGERHTANSVWAGTGWLKERGAYSGNGAHVVIFEL